MGSSEKQHSKPSRQNGRSYSSHRIKKTSEEVSFLIMDLRSPIQRRRHKYIFIKQLNLILQKNILLILLKFVLFPLVRDRHSESKIFSLLFCLFSLSRHSSPTPTYTASKLTLLNMEVLLSILACLSSLAGAENNEKINKNGNTILSAASGRWNCSVWK